jgi:hypothetical protein
MLPLLSDTNAVNTVYLSHNGRWSGNCVLFLADLLDETLFVGDSTIDTTTGFRGLKSIVLFGENRTRRALSPADTTIIDYAHALEYATLRFDTTIPFASSTLLRRRSNQEWWVI